MGLSNGSKQGLSKLSPQAQYAQDDAGDAECESKSKQAQHRGGPDIRMTDQSGELQSMQRVVYPRVAAPARIHHHESTAGISVYIQTQVRSIPDGERGGGVARRFGAPVQFIV